MNIVTSNLADELVGCQLTVSERFPILCEIVKKTETLQVRAIAVLFADESWKESHGTWTAFCRSEFQWDDSYASRMKRAAKMVIDGTSITTEAQARALASVPQEKRNEILDKCRDENGSEPSASQIVEKHSEFHDDASESLSFEIEEAQAEIDQCIFDMRSLLKKIKAINPHKTGRWINMSHLIADLKSAAEALKHARPHGPCDEHVVGDQKCICAGNGWLPKHVLDRPRGGFPK